MKNIFIFAVPKMVIVAQLVRAPDCGSGGRGFESRLSPFFKAIGFGSLFLFDYLPRVISKQFYGVQVFFVRF